MRANQRTRSKPPKAIKINREKMRKDYKAFLKRHKMPKEEWVI